jgi:hypothetical protein
MPVAQPSGRPSLRGIKLGPLVGVVTVKGFPTVKVIDAVRYERYGSLSTHSEIGDLDDRTTNIVLYRPEFVLVPDQLNAQLLNSARPFVGYAKGRIVRNHIVRHDHKDWIPIRRKLPDAPGSLPAFVTIDGEEKITSAKMVLIRRREGCGGFLPWIEGCDAKILR